MSRGELYKTTVYDKTVRGPLSKKDAIYIRRNQFNTPRYSDSKNLILSATFSVMEVYYK